MAAVCEERKIYRLDHYLGKETVQNLMAPHICRQEL